MRLDKFLNEHNLKDPIEIWCSNGDLPNNMSEFSEYEVIGYGKEQAEKCPKTVYFTESFIEIQKKENYTKDSNSELGQYDDISNITNHCKNQINYDDAIQLLNKQYISKEEVIDLLAEIQKQILETVINSEHLSAGNKKEAEIYNKAAFQQVLIIQEKINELRGKPNE